jgi:hypothetical protein
LPDVFLDFFKLKLDYGGVAFLKAKVGMNKFKKIAKNQKWIK